MVKKDIKTRDDIYVLVKAFYEKVKQNTVLGLFLIMQ